MKNIKKIKKIDAGLRCSTYVIDDNGESKILQEYKEGCRYQAKKKEYIYNLVNAECEKIPIPEVLRVGETVDYSYLITEYIKGNMLSEIYKEGSSVIYDIADCMAKIISQIHRIKNTNGKYGWIENETTVPFQTLEEYLHCELIRFKEALLTEFDIYTVEYILNFGKEAIEQISKNHNTNSVLNWYDINATNILVKQNDNKYIITGFIDPGAARWGVKEWDLAFTKIDLFKKETEFNYFIKQYEKYAGPINTSLLKAFCVFVELDDLVLQVNDKKIYDIQPQSTFKKFLKELEQKYNYYI